MADVITKIVNGHLASKLDELMRGLIAYEGGDATVWRTVTLPTAEEEDCKRQHRERRVLIQERGRHVNRISRRRSNTHSIERA
jgi:transposase